MMGCIICEIESRKNYVVNNIIYSTSEIETDVPHYYYVTSEDIFMNITGAIVGVCEDHNNFIKNKYTKHLHTIKHLTKEQYKKYLALQ